MTPQHVSIPPSALGRALTVGLLLSVGAFGIDMYIPAFEKIGTSLHVRPGSLQLTMTAYFVALAIGQLIAGPLSDVLGRRLPIFGGLSLYMAASLGAAQASSIDGLVVARFIQGFGVAATAVVPLAIIRDEYSGPTATRLLSIAMLALSVSPLLAPALGGLIAQYGSWRMIFLALVGIGLIATLIGLFGLPETLPKEGRVAADLSVLKTYGRLIRDERFLAPILVASFAQAILLLFIAGSPFVIVTLHHVSPLAFGGIFALHAAALIGTSQFCAALEGTVGARRLIGCAGLVVLLATSLLAALVAGGSTSLWTFLSLTMIAFVGLGLIMAPAYMKAVEPFDAVAGAAASLGTSVQLAISSVATIVMAMISDGTARPMATMLSLCACGVVACWMWFARLSSGSVHALPDRDGRPCVEQAD